ncbi:MAG: hypothetical protein ABFD18_18255 [Syntrophomonas sp.]
MKIAIVTCPVAPIHPAAFSTRSYRPKRKVPGLNNKQKVTPSSFSTILSALLTANDRTR